MLQKSLLTALAFFGSTVVSFAAGCPYGLCVKEVGEFINSFNSSIVAALGTLFLALAVVGFFLGVVRFIWAQQQGEKNGIEAGKETLKWGLVALFCAFSVYGIIRFGQNIAFGSKADEAGTVKVPRFIIEPSKPTGGERPPTPSSSGGERPPTPSSSGERPPTSSSGQTDYFASAYQNCLLNNKLSDGVTPNVAACQTALENMRNPTGSVQIKPSVSPEQIPDIPFGTETSCTNKNEGDPCNTDWGTTGFCSTNGLCG